jgi:hypothetical protein
LLAANVVGAVLGEQEAAKMYKKSMGNKLRFI